MSRMPGMRWYDIDGNEISIEAANELLVDIDARRVAYTQLDGGVFVSTVHLVLDHGWEEGEPPLIFESMIFPDCEVVGRTSTKHAALAMHDQIVADLRQQQQR